MRHPFLAIQNDNKFKDQVFILRVQRTDTRLHITIVKEIPTIVCRDIGDAEDMFLARMLAQPPVERPAEQRFKRLVNHIITQATFIGQRTKRGTGNVLLLHPDSIEQLDRQVFEPDQSNRGSNDNGWHDEGRFNISMRVVSSAKMPHDRLLLVYRGDSEVDAPAFVLMNGSSLMLHFQEQTPDSFLAAEDYCTVIKLDHAALPDDASGSANDSSGMI